MRHVRAAPTRVEMMLIMSTANFVLVDIPGQMLRLARSVLGGNLMENSKMARNAKRVILGST